MLGGVTCGFIGVNEDAAVGIGLGPDRGFELEILKRFEAVFSIADVEEVGFEFAEGVANEEAVFNLERVRVVVGAPAGKVTTVEEGEPIVGVERQR